MRRIPYATVDVFADRPLEGNPLAVVPDAAGLSDREMLAVAREFNLSETTFVLRRERSVERTEGIRTRIFSTQEEMPFAGHPTLGTAAVLRRGGEGPEVVLQLNVGRVPVRFSSRAGHEFGEMTQVDPTFGAVHDRERVAEALGLPPGEIVADLPVETVSTGVPFAIVPIGRLSTLRAWVPEWPRMERYLRRTDAKFFYLVCRETVAPEANLHARMAFYAGDDPATGSAAGPAAAWLVRHGQVPSGGPVEIEQGLEAGRPSRLSARATRHGEKVTDVTVGGGFAPVGQGELRLP